MIKPESPCLFCCARKLGCHTDCKEYNEFIKARKTYREYITKQKVEENEMEELELKRFRK